LHRSGVSATFPARFQLVVATNPCPCGQYGVPGGVCECAPQAIRRYTRRLSGPLLDRIDLDLRLQRVSDARRSSAAPVVTTRDARDI
ncbi:ATP-binding protein, partial [Vibrio parahaemolyticus]